MGQGRTGIWWIAGLVIAGIVAFAVSPFSAWSSRGDSLRTEADTVTASRRTLQQSITATGVVRPVVGAEIDVGSRVSGTVRRLTVEVGDRVAAGDLLAEIEATELDAGVEQAAAELASAAAERERARSSFRRVEQLAGEGIVAPTALDLARRDLDVAEARVLAAQASLRSARVTLGYTRITAPIGGVVAVVGTREGETVAASFAAPTFVTLVDLDRLEVQAYVDETDIGRVSVGQRASFTVDTAPDVVFGATVVTIEPKAVVESSVVEYVARLRIDAPSADGSSVGAPVLRPEMTAHVRFELARRDDVLTLPREALRRRDGRRSVLVLRGGAWVEQEVEVGWLTDHEAEIVAGVAEGETVQKNPQ